ncbi:MAG: 4-deoxy-4-formamido-L-arabinose-phosphoundecaprenol deformylase, partial [Deltaproteobacteria bacterium]|nr:4-deoxy-4-formamido-L-arabinose-phosphoundecaprenol deformylase [Deltaproteobacteria bacterium]
MEERVIALKIDVDTHQGMKLGVPTLLAILRDFGIQATFFLSFGPDNSGKAVWNLLRRRGFLSKMIRTRAPRLYGLRTLFYGTLLPAPHIALAFPETVRQIDREGHEIGVHAWDHRRWQDHLDQLSRQEIGQEFDKSFRAYREILGRDPKATAAPAWYCTRDSLEVQESLGLDYSSDTRGEGPFYPRIGKRVFKTLQIPSNQPCIEEIIGLNGMSRAGLVAYQIARLKEREPNVLAIHAEVEGRLYTDAFARLLEVALGRGFSFLPLDRVCRLAKKKDLPVREIAYRQL